MENEPMSLEKFIRDNHTLLSTLGIFLAAAAFASNLKYGWARDIFSFLFIGTIILIWLEVKSKIPKKSRWRLELFGYFMNVSLTAFATYWLMEYRTFWNIFLFIPLSFIFFYVAWSFLESLRYRLWFIDKALSDRVASTILIVGIAIAAFIFAVYFSIPMNLLLDALSKIQK